MHAFAFNSHGIYPKIDQVYLYLWLCRWVYINQPARTLQTYQIPITCSWYQSIHWRYIVSPACPGFTTIKVIEHCHGHQLYNSHPTMQCFPWFHTSRQQQWIVNHRTIHWLRIFSVFDSYHRGSSYGKLIVELVKHLVSSTMLWVLGLWVSETHRHVTMWLNKYGIHDPWVVLLPMQWMSWAKLGQGDMRIWELAKERVRLPQPTECMSFLINICFNNEC